MPSGQKKSREELIAGGYCPICSKCTSQTADGLDGLYGGCTLYACRNCGTLLLEAGHVFSRTPRFIEVTERWDEIKAWHAERRDEFYYQVSELEKQFSEDIRNALIPMMPFRGLSVVNASVMPQETPEEWRRALRNRHTANAG